MKFKKFIAVLLAIGILLSLSVASFAYEYGYSALPTSYQEQIDEMYDEYAQFDPAGFEEDEYKAMSNVFPDTSSPSWRTVSSFNGSNLYTQDDFETFVDNCPKAAVIRCIYAENTNSSDRYNSMCATADVIQNRSTNGYYSDYTYTLKGVVMKTNHFSVMFDPLVAVRNPFLFDNTTERDAYNFAVYLAYNMNDNQSASHLLPSTYYNFHDTIDETASEIPFFIKTGNTYTRCLKTEDSLEDATHFLTSNGVYNPIYTTAPPIVYGTTVFFSY